MTRSIDAMLFDKDGTLFDFHATWSVWAYQEIQFYAEGQSDSAERLARAMHYDLDAQMFLPTSPIIACTNREAAECMASALPGTSVDAIEQHMMQTAARAQLVPAVPLAPFSRRSGRAGDRARGDDE